MYICTHPRRCSFLGARARARVHAGVQWRSRYAAQGLPSPHAGAHDAAYASAHGGGPLPSSPSRPLPKLGRLGTYAEQLHRRHDADEAMAGYGALGGYSRRHSGALQHAYTQRGRMSYDGSYDPAEGIGSVQAATEAGAPIGEREIARRAMHACMPSDGCVRGE